MKKVGQISITLSILNPRDNLTPLPIVHSLLNICITPFDKLRNNPSSPYTLTHTRGQNPPHKNLSGFELISRVVQGEAGADLDPRTSPAGTVPALSLTLLVSSLPNPLTSLMQIILTAITP
jgi:hypothetical protein